MSEDRSLAPAAPTPRCRPGWSAGLASLLLGGLCMVGCVTEQEALQSDGRAPQLVWPMPPAAPRFVYQTTLRSSADIIPVDRTQRLKTLLTGGAERVARMTKPHSVAAGDGRVYVSDTVARCVHVFDARRGRYFAFGLRREGRLVKPLGLTLDAAGQVYVADASARRVVMFDALGLYLGSFGDDSILQRPTDVTVSADGSRVYVADVGGVESDRHQVVAFDRAGRVLFRIEGRGAGPGQLNLPVSLALAGDGTLYVLEAGNFRVQAFDASGRHLRAWGSVGRGFGQFARPKSVAVDRHGRVYVADAAFGNVQVFDASGRLLLPVGRAAREDRPGEYALLGGVSVDAQGFVYLLDPLFNKIDVLRMLDATGT
ncbi:MAG: SMP-30/gluconolactonase/LRE family protein [Gammaproteobacteria bacterium]|nr:SMP-30/gluconolactonase/LRE family protein [Gammaproteobacteria bacterium]